MFWPGVVEDNGAADISCVEFLILHELQLLWFGFSSRHVLVSSDVPTPPFQCETKTKMLQKQKTLYLGKCSFQSFVPNTVSHDELVGVRLQLRQASSARGLLRVQCAEVRTQWFDLVM